MSNAAKSKEQTESEKLTEVQREQEIYALMRQTRRSRVQVLNAIHVRGPEREAILRALGSR